MANSTVRAAVVLAAKDIKLLLRDRMGFFFTFFWPLLMAVFFGVIFSGQSSEKGPRRIPIVAVDEDRTPASGEFVALLEKAPEFSVERADSRESAEALVRAGKRTAFVAVTPGFGDATERMFYGDPAKIVLAVDPSRSAEAAMLEGLLQRYGYERMQSLFGADPEAMRKSTQRALDTLAADAAAPPALRGALEPFLRSLMQFSEELPGAVEEAGEAESSGGGFQPLIVESVKIAGNRAAPPNAYAITFPQGILWGVLGVCAAFGISLVVERSKGTLVRLQSAPMSRAAVLLGKGLACGAVTLLVGVVLLVIGRAAFGVAPQSPALLALALVSVAICFVGVMMALACVGKTEAAAGGIGWAVLLVFAMLGGGMIPQFVMPEWMAKAGAVSPVFWSIRALEGAIWRGFTLAEMAPICGVLIGIGAGAFALGAALFRWAD